MKTINTTVKADTEAESEGGIDGLLAAVTKMAAESKRSRRAMGGTMTEIAAGWVMPHYLVALRGELASGPDGAERFKLLRRVAGDVVLLQRGGVWVARLELEREKFKFQKKKHRELMAAGKPGKRRDPNTPMTDEELKACVDKVDEIMGLKRVPGDK